MSTPVTRLSDYQPPVFAVNNLCLDIALYEDHALVKNTMLVTRQHPGPLILMGNSLELISIDLNGQPMDKTAFVEENGNLVIPQMPDSAELMVITRIYPQKNTQLSGLYRSNGLFCTQCEAEGFRSITFYPDRPDVLTTFTTKISADKDKYPVLLSNGNLIDSGDAEKGRHWVLWEDPFKKPSYLFALVAGKLACVQDIFITASGRQVILRIFVEPGNEDSCAHAMTSLKNAMLWDEEVYGREYDLDTFMIVAVSDFNMGAMENKGLNIFNAKYILAKPDSATDADFADIESVVAHEYFHNWTGNRVTCRDWFQLSLKEGLTVFRDQEFSRDMNSRDVNRIDDVNLLRNIQFPEDAGKMAHPVRPETYQEISNFYTATIYNKGAEVIRMQHTLLGVTGFRNGMDLYFKRHDGQAVTIDDFVSAMEDANQVDLTQFKRWYSQAGTPEIWAQTEFAGNKLTLTLMQSCPATPECENKKPFHIPISIALLDESGAFLPVKNPVLELKEIEQHFVFEDLSAKPAVSLLRDFSAPVILHFDQSESDLLTILRFETNGFSKWDVSRRLMRGVVLEWLSQACDPESVSLSLLDACQGILKDETLDSDLRASILTPPGFEDIVRGLTEIDVTKIECLRDCLRKELGDWLYEAAHKMYAELWIKENHDMQAEAYGRRKLRNICLYYLMKSRPEAVISQCQNQYQQAKTMTDQIAALHLLAQVDDTAIRTEALEHFHDKWSNNDLVLDKWFSIQALSELPDTLKQVKKLMKHPAFKITNPNRVRAVIGAFTQNMRHFHAEDGSGYIFLTDMLKKLDPINPQIAARLATPFTRWQRYNKPRQELIQEQLQELAKGALSVDLREMVMKSLA